uniref:transcription elongation factor GreA n=1 Tax=Ndongobacter massiliensis TaxID=1871025 RepID=UPI00093072AE|nr:transcription elongation factor GreA [Ndongobacter massiliensis]
MTQEIFLTQEGYDKLEAELEYLKATKRQDIAEKIRVARGFGDLSENAEYDAAKEEQAQLEERIYSIEQQLKNAKIIEDDRESAGDAVKIGSTVRVFDVEYKEEMTFTIVGTVEANPKKQKISNESPLGKALIGAKVGATVTVETPGGMVEYKILELVK